MNLSAEEFRKKLHSGELMPKGSGLKYALKSTIAKANDHRQPKRKENAPEKPAGGKSAKKRAVKGSFHPQLSKIDTWMKGLGIRFETEFRFSDQRKFRADRYLPDYNILIEYEGIGFMRDGSQKKTGHTSLLGYTKDCEKYNLATEMGFKVFRYTAKNHRQCKEMLKRLVKSNR